MSEITDGLIANAQRIATLEATVATLDRIGVGYRARVKVLETLEPEYKRLVNKLEELEGELAEAMEWIDRLRMGMPLDDFEDANLKSWVEKHK